MKKEVQGWRRVAAVAPCDLIIVLLVPGTVRSGRQMRIVSVCQKTSKCVQLSLLSVFQISPKSRGVSFLRGQCLGTDKVNGYINFLQNSRPKNGLNCGFPNEPDLVAIPLFYMRVGQEDKTETFKGEML